MIGKVALIVFLICTSVVLLQDGGLVHLTADTLKLVCLVGAVGGFIAALTSLV